MFTVKGFCLSFKLFKTLQALRILWPSGVSKVEFLPIYSIILYCIVWMQMIIRHFQRSSWWMIWIERKMEINMNEWMGTFGKVVWICFEIFLSGPCQTLCWIKFIQFLTIYLIIQFFTAVVIWYNYHHLHHHHHHHHVVHPLPLHHHCHPCQYHCHCYLLHSQHPRLRHFRLHYHCRSHCHY